MHVSAGLRRDGGGTAHLGRVYGRALRRYSARRRWRYTGLHLPACDGEAALDGFACFGGSRLRLTLRVLGMQLASRRRLLLFDHPGPARAQALLPARLRSPYLIVTHGIEIWRPLGRQLESALRGAARVFASTRASIAAAQPHLPAGCALTLLPPGREPAQPPSHAKLPNGLAPGFVLTVGRLESSERYKGIDELIEAWPAVVARLPEARLVVVGEGSDRPRLERKARDLGLEGSIRFLGFVSTALLDALYRAAALFALPSRGEGFGLVFLEAMAVAKPCLALRDTAPAEIVVDGETGRLVPAGDGPALERALIELLSDPDRARVLGEAGRRRYESELTFDAFERRLVPVLDELALAGAA